MSWCSISSKYNISCYYGDIYNYMIYFYFKMSWNGYSELPFSGEYSGHRLEPDVVLKLLTTGFEFAISQQRCPVKESQKSRTERVWTHKQDICLKVWMSISNETSFTQISKPADQDPPGSAFLLLTLTVCCISLANTQTPSKHYFHFH